MEEDKNLEQNLDKSNEKLHISDVSLFDRLKEVINEYCSLNDATSVEVELNYHIKIYEERIKNGKNVIINYH